MKNHKEVKYLDEEEKDLDEALKAIDVHKQSVPNAETQEMFKNAALNFVKQEAKMNIRISPLELEEIKKRAATEGLKYQSFVKSVLHKYITGQLTEIKAG